MPTDGQRGHTAKDATADLKEYAGKEVRSGPLLTGKKFSRQNVVPPAFTSGTGRKEVEPRAPAPFALFP